MGHHRKTEAVWSADENASPSHGTVQPTGRVYAVLVGFASSEARPRH